MITYNFDKTIKKPLYEQLYLFIKNDIITGVIPSGSKLPSKRELSAHLGLSKITIENAYSLLISEGYIYSLEKKGYFVEEKLSTHQTALNRDYEEDTNIKYKVDLVSNSVPPEHFPFRTWSKLMRNVCLDHTEELLKPIRFNGAYCLRSAIAEYLFEERGVNVSPDDILIGAGSEYLYGIIAKLISSDSEVAVEEPTHTKILRVYNFYNVKSRSIPIDDEGISMDLLNKSGCNAVHISPSHNFPSGIITTIKRRKELIEWLSEDNNRYIIEDDFDSELRITGRPIPSLFSTDINRRTIYLNTFSKTISPSVRISYCVLPHELTLKAKELFRNYSCTVASFEQYTLSEFIKNGYFQRHINRNRKYYINHHKVLTDIFENKNISRLELMDSDSGLHFMIRINSSVSDDIIKNMLYEYNINSSFYSDYFNSTLSENNHLLLVNYSGISKDDFSFVLDRLNEILINNKI